MQLHTPELRAVLPQNTVNGFDIEVIRHDTNLVNGQEHARFFSNRFVQINASCDGSNPNYPEQKNLTLLVTQYSSEDESKGILLEQDVGIIVLKHFQTLTACGVFEIRQTTLDATVLILWIKDTILQSTATAVYTLAHKRIRLH